MLPSLLYPPSTPPPRSPTHPLPLPGPCIKKKPHTEFEKKKKHSFCFLHCVVHMVYQQILILLDLLFLPYESIWVTFEVFCIIINQILKLRQLHVVFFPLKSLMNSVICFSIKIQLIYLFPNNMKWQNFTVIIKIKYKKIQRSELCFLMDITFLILD
jgi:hypothetical protein